MIGLNAVTSFMTPVLAADGPMGHTLDKELIGSGAFALTMQTLTLVVAFVILLALMNMVAKRIATGPESEGNQRYVTKGRFAQIIEVIVIAMRDMFIKPQLGAETNKFLPFLLTLFFFIFFGNLLGLVPFFPGGANLTGNISVTLALALFTFLITAFSGNKVYWAHIFNTPGVPWWLKVPIPLIPIIELAGMFIKPFVLMIRLFANITAGHIIVLGFFSLIFVFGEMHTAAGYGASVVSIAFTVFISMLELLVAFIQAYVFTVLSALYFGMATEEHH